MTEDERKERVSVIAEGVAQGIRQAEADRARLEAWASQNPPDGMGKTLFVMVLLFLLMVWLW